MLDMLFSSFHTAEQPKILLLISAPTAFLHLAIALTERLNVKVIYNEMLLYIKILYIVS